MATDDFIQDILASYAGGASPRLITSLQNLKETDKQRLINLLSRLRGLPLPELILESSRIRCPGPDSSSGRQRLRLAMAAAISASRVLPYLTRIQDLNVQRQNAVLQIEMHKDRASELLLKDTEKAIAHILQCHLLAPEIEVAVHMISICTSHLAKILPLAAAPIGHKISKQDRKLLHQFDDLRHHFEHLEDRLPGKSRKTDFVREIDDETGWGMEVGIRTNESGHLTIDDVTFAVSTPVLDEVDQVVRENMVRMRISALAEVAAYFAKCPDLIPDPSTIKSQPMVSLGFEFDGGVKV